MLYVLFDDTGPLGWVWPLPDGQVQLCTHRGGATTFGHRTPGSPGEVLLVLGRHHQQLERDLHVHGQLRWEPPALQPGQFYPRIQRQMRPHESRETFMEMLTKGFTFGVPMTEFYGRECQSSISASRALFFQLDRIFQSVEPDELHIDVFGHELRHLLMLACAEVESAMKAILKANGVKPEDGHFKMKDYRKLIDPMRLTEWSVELRSYPDYPKLTPFAEWPEKRPPQWWQAHNATKHDRELELKSATFGAALNAVAALYITIAAQFGAEVLDAPGVLLPMRLTEGGLPKWAATEFYVPPNVMGVSGGWTPLRFNAGE